MKMSKKGRVIYCPRRLLDEIENVKTNYNYDKNSDALKKIAEFVPVGTEIDKAIQGTGLFNRRRRK